MHDIHQTTIDALPTVLDYLKSQGYTFVTVDELLDYQLEAIASITMEIQRKNPLQFIH